MICRSTGKWTRLVLIKMVTTYLRLRLPYNINTFNLFPVVSKSLLDMFMTMSSLRVATQSSLVSSSFRRKGQYIRRICMASSHALTANERCGCNDEL